MATTPKNPYDSYSNKLAQDIDEALDKKNLQQMENEINTAEIDLENHDTVSQAKICYSIGTYYGNLMRLGSSSDNERYCEKQLFFLKKAKNCYDSIDNISSDIEPFLKGLLLPLYTNYGNALEDCGRRIPALYYYHLAMAFMPRFAMAKGNAGISYFNYAALLYDNSHRYYVHYFAYQYLKSTIENPRGVHPDAEATFKRVYSRYDDKDRELFEKDLCVPQCKFAKKEFEYRKWALDNQLFINPLNDLPIVENCFAADVLHLPGMIVGIHDKPALPGLYNQLKQEYVFSRYLFYESIQPNTKVHFADKENLVYQFADYPTYSIRIEKMKAAYRLVYSIFDKVAFFLNRYFNLGLAEGIVNFKRIWRTRKLKEKDEFRNVLIPVENSALKALYWMSKELFDQDGSFYTSPNAPRKNEIRNALEHKYVKVYNDVYPARIDGEIDDMAIYISETELENITMDILKQIREVLIYLSLAVHIEECNRRKANEAIYVISESFLKYDDKWKL